MIVYICIRDHCGIFGEVDEANLKMVINDKDMILEVTWLGTTKCWSRKYMTQSMLRRK